MTDVVERLREEARWQRVEYRNFGLAEEIDRGAAEIERLRAGGQREAALREAWQKIDGMIIRGPLPGNGTDRSAERNGMILATNVIMALIKDAPETPEQANVSNERGDSE